MENNTQHHDQLSLAIVSVILFCTITPFLFLVITGAVQLSISSFAVDSKDCLYVGTRKGISIYDNFEYVGAINPKTSRTYMFTINEADQIVLSTSDKIYLMDLDGNVLDTKDDLGADVYNQLSYKKWTYTSQNGDVYKLNIGCSKITKNGNEVVFQIDGLSTATKYILLIAFVILFIYLVAMLICRSKTLL